MTQNEWLDVFDVLRAFMVAGVSIGLVAAIFNAAHE